MSESDHSSLPSYPTLPPSELDQLPDLSSLNSSVASSYGTVRPTTASHSEPVSDSTSSAWFSQSPSAGLLPTRSLYTAQSYPSSKQHVDSPQYPTYPVAGLSSTAQQHSALHMYNQSSSGVSSGVNTQVGSPASSSVPSSPSSSSSPHLRIHYLEQLCMTLKREKEQGEAEFGRQRKMFMKHMTEVDNQISVMKEANLKLSDEVRDLSTRLLLKDEELKSVAVTSKKADAKHREAFDADRVKYEEEIAHLRLTQEVQRKEQASALNQEREKWRQEKLSLLSEIRLLKGRSISPNPTPLLSSSATSNENSRTCSPEESLETSMMRAAEDSKILRAVIIPLEEEIDLLKTKLSEAEERIKYYETQRHILSSMSPERDLPLISLESPVQPPSTSYSLPTSPSPTPTDPNKQLQNLLELERAATHDLEMHTKQLKSQKAFLQNEVSALTKSLEQVNKDFEVERNRHNELKKTWELANTHFIAAQDQLKLENEQLQLKLQEAGVGEAKMKDRLLGMEQGLMAAALRTNNKRSLSTEDLDVGINSLGSMAKNRIRSASSGNLHQVSAANMGKVFELSARVSKLESELATARAEVVSLKGVRLALETQCSRYESQLHRVQVQMVEEMDGKERTIDKLRAEMEKYKAGIMRERQIREELRNKMDNTKDEMGTRIEKFRGEEEDVTRQLRMLNDKFTEIKIDTQKEITRLVQERASLYQQIEAVREEYECLKVVQATGINDYKAQLTHASKNQKEAELNLQTTMEQLSTLQLEKQEVEETLASQLAATKEELMTERAKFERLKRQLEIANDKLTTLEAVQLVLKEERSSKEELLANKQSIERKSKEFIENQQRKMEELNQAKENAEKQVKELQHQMSLLKSQLTYSEKTQKDFVELSQSLQMRLAEIEEQQTNQNQDSTSTNT